jgi:hypothetical protein
MGELHTHHERPSPLITRGFTSLGPSAGIQQSRPITHATWRTTQRKIWCADGREGIEFVEEHHLVYGRPDPRNHHDTVRSALAAVVSFIGVAIVFTAAGGGEQSFAWAPVYWLAFLGLWASLA